MANDLKVQSRRSGLSVAKVVIVAGVLVVIPYVAWIVYVLHWRYPVDHTLSTTAAFADSLGVINALFSGLGLAAIAATLVLGQRQLEIQQDQIRDSAVEMEEQRQFLAKQAVQTQFFQMLQSWQSVVEQITMPDGRKGRVALYAIANQMLRDMAVIVVDANAERRKAMIIEMYERVRRNRVNHIGHYFRLFYHIIRFIDQSPALTKDEEKQDFARILRAHLSEAEFALLFYNCIHPDGENLHPLVEIYDLLQNMSERSVAQPIDMEFYPETKRRWDAIGKRPLGIRGDYEV